MSNDKYRRNVEQLHKNASLFWPPELAAREAELSIIPKLIETQDDFISILSFPIADIERLIEIIASSDMPSNLFLKHLEVLSDFGGEPLQRINAQFSTIFPSGVLEYLWKGQQHIYQFQVLPIKGVLSNDKLGVSSRKILESQTMTRLQQDVIALLVLGSSAMDEHASDVLAKCEIGEYLGDKDKLEKFIKQRYIWVSRITGGSQSNNLGQIAQHVVHEYLEENLVGVDIQSNGHLPGITHTAANDDRLTTFDLVVSSGDRRVAVEISFQVTTNSVIERKSGQARSRYEQIDKAGYRIAYIVDGAGNFQRESAVNTICNYSHCTVAFSESELMDKAKR